MIPTDNVTRWSAFMMILGGLLGLAAYFINSDLPIALEPNAAWAYIMGGLAIFGVGRKIERGVHAQELVATAQELQVSQTASLTSATKQIAHNTRGMTAILLAACFVAFVAPAQVGFAQETSQKARDAVLQELTQDKTAPPPAAPQAAPQAETTEAFQLSVFEARDDFHSTAIQAAHQAMQVKLITRQEFRQFRVSMLSPAYRRDVQTLAETQMAFSDSEEVPRDASGGLDREQIDWPGFTAFLVAMMPYFMELLKIFLGGGFGVSELLMFIVMGMLG